MSKEKMCGNCGRDHKFVDCKFIDMQFPPTKVYFEKLKEDAQSYQNWLKFVAGRGLTDVLVEPLKVKERFDKLKKEIRYLQELNNGLNAACDVLKASRTKKEKLIGDLLHDKVELKKENDSLGSMLQEATHREHNLKKILEQFKEYNFELQRWTGDDFEWAFNQVKEKFKKILEEK